MTSSNLYSKTMTQLVPFYYLLFFYLRSLVLDILALCLFRYTYILKNLSLNMNISLMQLSIGIFGADFYSKKQDKILISIIIYILHLMFIQNIFGINYIYLFCIISQHKTTFVMFVLLFCVATLYFLISRPDLKHKYQGIYNFLFIFCSVVAILCIVYLTVVLFSYIIKGIKLV